MDSNRPLSPHITIYRSAGPSLTVPVSTLAPAGPRHLPGRASPPQPCHCWKRAEQPLSPSCRWSPAGQGVLPEGAAAL